MDSDIPNTDYLAYASNDTVADAQAIINPSIVTGFIGGSDTLDIYSVSTSSSMYVNLDVVDYIDDSKELRLYIYESDGSAREFSYTSASTEANMTILLPNGADYLIAVRQQNNSSKYVLTLGQRYSSSSMEVSTDFIPNYAIKEFVGYVPQNIESLNTKINKSSNRIQKLELSKNELFDSTGYSFDNPGIRSFQIKKTKEIQLELWNQVTTNNSIISGLQPISQKQVDYLNDWSQLQYLRSLDSNTIFDLNYTYQLSSFTRDPLYSFQWNLQRVGLEPTLNAIGQDVKDVAVAVIDSGGPTPNSTAWNASNLIDGGYDFVNGESKSIDYLATSNNTGNNLSHGTHVSTTISAKNDGVSFNGYAVKALNINVFSVIGTGANAKTGGASNANIANAILYASGLSNSSGSVAPNTTPIKVINLSLGGPSYSEALCAAVNDAISQGITVIAASGNAQDTNPGSISYPAACPGVISVGATNSADEISSYSQQNTHVDISAPGGDYVDRDGNGIPDLILAYGNDDADPIKAFSAGTSMASPQVSAAVALMYSVDSSMTPSRVENMLMAGELTNDLGDSGKDNVYGYGLLNIPKAIENVLQDISSSTTYAYTSASYLDFASTSTQLTVDLLKVGTGTLSVSSLGADNASGLSYNDSSANSDGFGTYTIIIDRSSIPNGEFSNTIYFNLSNGEKVAVRIYYNVGSLRSRANIGKAYIGMYDASDDSLWGSLEAVVNGSVSFTATDVAPGNYYILTSTDIDNDNTVCDYGELCEYYPKLGETTYYFTVSDSNLTGYEIFLQPLIKYGGVNAASIENNIEQLNNINKLSKQKSYNKNRNILINPIDSNIEFIQDNIGMKGDKEFISD
jgi:serine protease